MIFLWKSSIFPIFEAPPASRKCPQGGYGAPKKPLQVFPPFLAEAPQQHLWLFSSKIRTSSPKCTLLCVSWFLSHKCYQNHFLIYRDLKLLLINRNQYFVFPCTQSKVGKTSRLSVYWYNCNEIQFYKNCHVNENAHPWFCLSNCNRSFLHMFHKRVIEVKATACIKLMEDIR